MRDTHIDSAGREPDGSHRMSVARRRFLEQLAAGSVTATVLMMFGPGVSAITARNPGDTRGWKQRSQETAWAYVININTCIGCGYCVRACKRETSVPSEFFRTWVERYVFAKEGTYVESPKGGFDGFEDLGKEIRDKSLRSFTVPKMCNHCMEPPCVQVCPVGATFKAPEGFVLVDNEHCVGCGYCVQACPYGARFIHPETGKSDKCTWCYHRVKNGKLPACVTICPNKARLFGNLLDPNSEVARVYREDRWLVLKPHMATEPYCFYVGLPREVT